MASRTAGASIQGRKRERPLEATARPQPEQYRLSGLSASPQSGQNEPAGLTGYIISRGSGIEDASAQNPLEMGERPALDLVTGVARRVERFHGRSRHHDPVVAVAQVGDGVQDTDVGAHPDDGDLFGLRGAQ